MENKVTIFTEGTGWIEIDIPSFYKTEITGEMAYLAVWNFKSPNSTNFYSIKRTSIEVIKGPEDIIRTLEDKKYGK